jgi:hypothetical protein
MPEESREEAHRGFGSVQQAKGPRCRSSGADNDHRSGIGSNDRVPEPSRGKHPPGDSRGLYPPALMRLPKSTSMRAAS